MIGRIAPLALALALATPVVAQTGTAAMGPTQALAAAAAAPTGEVQGTFDMVVGSTGASGFRVFLNSAANYHDPANFTIELESAAKAALRARLGGEPQNLMTGKHIRVSGVAKRVPVKQRDGTTAYQTRVIIEDPAQLLLVE